MNLRKIFTTFQNLVNMSKRNLIEQAFDKLVTQDEKQKWIRYTKKYPLTKITVNGITYQNGKILWVPRLDYYIR